MEKRALLAVVLSLLILLAFQKFTEYRYGTAPAPQMEKAEEKPAPPAAPLRAAEPKKAAPPSESQVKDIRVETDLYVAVFTNRGGRLKSFVLKQYRSEVDEKSPPFEMIPSAPQVPYPLGVRLSGPQPFDDEGLIYSVEGSDLKLAGNASGALVFRGRTPAGATLTKELSFTGSVYPVKLALSVDGADGGAPPALILTSPEVSKEKTKDAVFEGLLAVVANKTKREDADNIE